MPDIASEMLRLLNDPTRVWRHAFTQVPKRAQMMFLNAVTLSPRADIDMLRKLTSQYRSTPFVDALRVLDDTFLSTDRQWIGEERIIAAPRNPSLLDFGWQYLAEDLDILDELVDGFQFFEQFQSLIGAADPQSAARAPLARWIGARADRLWTQLLARIRDLPALTPYGWHGARRLESLIDARSVLPLPSAGTEARRSLLTFIRELMEDVPTPIYFSLLNNDAALPLIEEAVPDIATLVRVRAYEANPRHWEALAWADHRLDVAPDWLDEFESLMDHQMQQYTSTGDEQGLTHISETLDAVTGYFTDDQLGRIQDDISEYMRMAEAQDDDHDYSSHAQSNHEFSWDEIDRMFSGLGQP